jgi:hypothetical protein
MRSIAGILRYASDLCLALKGKLPPYYEREESIAA